MWRYITEGGGNLDLGASERYDEIKVMKKWSKVVELGQKELK
jgi:hypothetical protein